MRMRRLVPIALLVAFAAAPVRADDLAVPRAAAALVLDGAPDEAAWATGAEALTGMLRNGTFEDGARPKVRLLVSEGRLWIGVEVEEAPGPGVGLVLMVGPEGTETAAEALVVAYSPQSVRAPRWVVHGPRGPGRGTYRVEGAVDVGHPDRWSLEVALPLVDLALPAPEVPLRLALVVRTRVPAHVAWAPPGAAWLGPASWTRLVSTAPWPQADVDVDGDALAEADRLDDDRLYAWATFSAAYQAQIADLLQAAGHTADPSGPGGRDAVRDALRQLLVGPLEQIHALRPDLAYAHVVRGGVLHQMGRDDEAQGAFDRALELMPGLGEARFGIHLELVGPSLAVGPVGGPTDYASAFAAAAAAAAPDGYAAEGVAFGTGLLHLARGDFAEALALLGPLAARYPFQQSLVYAASRARLGLERWPREERYRQLETEQDDLPRVRLTTSKGEILLELFEDDAGNTVKNFVWLAGHGFYDGSPVARTVPFLLAEVGAGDPGWALATQRPPDRQRVGGGEARRRLPWRGTVVMLSATPDAAAARFALLTGAAPDLESDLIPFGRVIEGLAVVDALEAGDRVEKATVVRTRPGTEYRPLTVRGTPAPTPR